MTEQRLIVRNSQDINAIRCLDTRELSPKCQLDRASAGLGLAGKQAAVQRLRDGRIQLERRGVKLKWRELVHLTGCEICGLGLRQQCSPTLPRHSLSPTRRRPLLPPSRPRSKSQTRRPAPCTGLLTLSGFVRTQNSGFENYTTSTVAVVDPLLCLR